MYLNIFAWLEVENLLIVHNSTKDELSRALGVIQSHSRFVWRKGIKPKNGSGYDMDYN